MSAKTLFDKVWDAHVVKEVEGGFLVSGKWGKATGTDQATYFTCNGKLPSGEMVSLTLDSKDVHVYKDWNLSGMKSSSSFGFSANEAFVPNDYVVYIEPILSMSLAFITFEVGLNISLKEHSKLAKFNFKGEITSLFLMEPITHFHELLTIRYNKCKM